MKVSVIFNWSFLICVSSRKSSKFTTEKYILNMAILIYSLTFCSNDQIDLLIFYMKFILLIYFFRYWDEVYRKANIHFWITESINGSLTPRIFRLFVVVNRKCSLHGHISECIMGRCRTILSRSRAEYNFYRSSKWHIRMVIYKKNNSTKMVLVSL